MKTAKEGMSKRKLTTKEKLKPVENRIVGKQKQNAVTKPEKSNKKAAKDPNKPKRPACAFFIFLEDFRKTYQRDHPNVEVVVTVVGRFGGEKWKSMSKAEKAPFEAKAAKRKTDYEKLMTAYNNKQDSRVADDKKESDKSKSDANEDDESDEEDEEDDD